MRLLVCTYVENVRIEMARMLIDHSVQPPRLPPPLFAPPIHDNHEPAPPSLRPNRLLPQHPRLPFTKYPPFPLRTALNRLHRRLNVLRKPPPPSSSPPRLAAVPEPVRQLQPAPRPEASPLPYLRLPGLARRLRRA